MSEKNFTVRKSGRYYQTHILKFKPANFTIKYAWSTMNLHQDRQAVEKYMQFVLDMEKQVEKELKKRELDFEPLKLVVHSLKLVTSWSEGFDIRHDIGMEKQAELIVNWYVDAHDKAKAFNEEHFAEISKEGKGKYDRAKKDYRKDEDYKRNNELYELGMEDIEEYYGEDQLSKKLDDALKSTNELLEKLKKKEEEEKKEREEAMKGLKPGDKVLIPSAPDKRKDPDLSCVVEELLKDKIVKVKVHDKLFVEVPLHQMKFDK